MINDFNQLNQLIYPDSTKVPCKNLSHHFLLVGLGGVGIKALKEIRNKEQQHLMNADVHYLCIDSDFSDLKKVSDIFSEKERFLLRFSQDYSNPEIQKMAEKMSINVRLLLENKGAMNDRRVGRFLLLLNSNILSNRLCSIFDSISRNASYRSGISVHIITGLSGGTGGGCFIDLCYILRRILNNYTQSFNSFSVTGFFVLDALNSHFNDLADQFKRNTVASFLDLNTSMNLYAIGSPYIQNYSGFSVSTLASPVDNYFLFSGRGDYIQNIWEYILCDIIAMCPFDGIEGMYVSPLQSMFSNSTYFRVSIGEDYFNSFTTLTIYAPVSEVAAAFGIALVDSILSAKKEVFLPLDNQARSITDYIIREIYENMNRDCLNLQPPEMDNKLLRNQLRDGQGIVPEIWTAAGNHYLSVNEERRQCYVTNFLEEISSSINGKRWNAPIIREIISNLSNIFSNPEAGPEAAALFLDDIISNLVNEYRDTYQQVTDSKEKSIQIQNYLIDSAQRAGLKILFFPTEYLQNFRSAFKNYYIYIDKVNTVNCVGRILNELIKALNILRDGQIKTLSSQIRMFRDMCHSALEQFCQATIESDYNRYAFLNKYTLQDYLEAVPACISKDNQTVFLDKIFHTTFSSDVNENDMLSVMSMVCAQLFDSEIQKIACDILTKEFNSGAGFSDVQIMLPNHHTDFLINCQFQDGSILKKTKFVLLPEYLSSSNTNYDTNVLWGENGNVYTAYKYMGQYLIVYWISIDVLIKSPDYEKVYNELTQTNTSDLFFIYKSHIEEKGESNGNFLNNTDDIRAENLLRGYDKGEKLDKEDKSFLQSLHTIHLHDYVPERSITLLLNLRKLYFSGQLVQNLPEGINCLSFLEVLDLSFTSITSLPDTIAGLKDLKTLNLSGLNLDDIPEFLLDMPLEFTMTGSEGIVVDHLKVAGMTDLSILFVNRKMAKTWFAKKLKHPINNKSSEADSGFLPKGEVKIVFLGDANVGKTLTIQRILREGALIPDYKSSATRGISISNTSMSTGVGTATVHLWDFGGQDIYFAMHRLFFSDRTIYVIMVNARETHIQEKAKEWLDNVITFAPSCPVLLYVNQIDEIREPAIIPSELMKNYHSLKGVHYLSALTFERALFNDNAIGPIIEVIESMKDEIFQDYPKAWQLVRNRIVGSGQAYVTDKEFATICDEFGVDSDRDERINILKWLNDLGIGFSGSPMHLGEQYTVLDPEWITKVLYFLLNYRSFFTGGIVSAKECYTLQVNKREEKEADVPDYFTSDYEFILSTLCQYRLAYRLEYDRYFIPMLSTTKNTEYGEDLITDALSLHYHMDLSYLPVNILYRLCVEMSASLVRESIWSRGCVFELADKKLRVLVYLSTTSVYLYVKSDDQACPSISLLEHFRQTLLMLVRQMGLIVNKECIDFVKDNKEQSMDYCDFLAYLYAGDVSHLSFLPMLQNERFPSVKRHDLLGDLVYACTSLQDKIKYATEDENPRTSYICSLLRAKKYVIAEQQPGGVSGTGKSHGFPDVTIYDGDKPFAILEALNVRLNTFINNKSERKYLQDHIEKVLDGYNPLGLPQCYLLVYLNCNKKSFDSYYSEYKRFVIDECELKNFTPIDHWDRSDKLLGFLKVLEIRYDCSGIPVVLFHIVVRMMTEETSQSKSTCLLQDETVGIPSNMDGKMS